MKFTPLSLSGTYVIELEPIEDNRGFFAMSWQPEAFASRGLETHIAQCNLSFNHQKGTIRGMHFQREPYAEVKLLRCTTGAIFDALIDLRPESPTYLQWEAVELTAENRRMLYIPKGLAHGYQTLADNTEVSYQVSETYHPEAADGVRWNDPAFNIQWPLPCSQISSRDEAWADYVPLATV